MAVAICACNCLSCPLIALIVATRLSTSCRRVVSSIFPDPGRGSAAELCQQLRGLLAAGVVLPDEEPAQARFSQAARVHGAGVALEARARSGCADP